MPSCQFSFFIFYIFFRNHGNYIFKMRWYKLAIRVVRTVRRTGGSRGDRLQDYFRLGGYQVTECHFRSNTLYTKRFSLADGLRREPYFQIFRYFYQLMSFIFMLIYNVNYYLSDFFKDPKQGEIFGRLKNKNFCWLSILVVV